MAETTNLAARLLAFAPSTEVVDALLPAAVITDDEMLVAAAPSTRLGIQQAKRGVKYAATIAGAPVSDPALLERLGKLPQKTVRRLLAGKPDTPQATLEQLAEWAVRENDDETLNALCNTLPPPQWLPRLRPLRDCEDYSATDGYLSRQARTLPKLHVTPFINQLARRQDTEMTWETYRLGIIPVCREIAKAAAFGRLPVHPADLVDATAAHLRPSILDAIMANPTVDLDPRIVAHLVSWLGDPDLPRLPTNYRHHIEAARTLNDTATEAFIDSGITWLVQCVTVSADRGNVELTDDQIARIIATGDRSAADVLLRSNVLRSRLTGDQLVEVATIAGPDKNTVRRILADHGAELPPVARVNLLRHGDKNVTVDWLTGQLGCLPTRAELEELAAKPGQALPTAGISGLQRAGSTVAAFIDQLAPEFKLDTATSPGVDVVFNAAGQTTLRWAALGSGNPYPGRPNGFTAYLAARLSAAFGADPEAWTTAALLADKVTVETVDDFITVVAGMLTSPAQATA